MHLNNIFWPIPIFGAIQLSYPAPWFVRKLPTPAPCASCVTPAASKSSRSVLLSAQMQLHQRLCATATLSSCIIMTSKRLKQQVVQELAPWDTTLKLLWHQSRLSGVTHNLLPPTACGLRLGRGVTICSTLPLLYSDGLLYSTVSDAFWEGRSSPPRQQSESFPSPSQRCIYCLSRRSPQGQNGWAPQAFVGVASATASSKQLES